MAIGAALLGLTGSSQSPAQITVSVEWRSFGAPGNDIAEVGGMAEASGGKVLITDQKSSMIYSYDPSTRRTVLLSRPGQGPNETQLPSLATTLPDGGVAVHDLGNNRVVFYGADGGYRRTLTLIGAVQNPKGFASLQDGSLVLSGGRFRSARSVFRFHPGSGAITDSAVSAPSSRDRSAVIHVAGGALFRSADGSLLYSNSAPHGIYRITPLFDVLRIAADEALVPPIVDSFNKPITAPDGRPALAPQWYYDQSRMVAELASGNILNVITRVYREDSVWEVWSPSGHLVARTTVPLPYRPFNLTRDGLVLASIEDPSTGLPSAVGLRLVGIR
jgi:hypothetical protein